MAKSVEIEIIDKKLVTTTTGGGIPTLSQNNVPNDNFNVALGSGNVGQAGCISSSNPLSYIGINLNSNSGTPDTSNWFPCSFKEGAGGGNASSFCGIFYRETPIPYRNGSSQCVFPGTAPTSTAPNFVRNGGFDGTVSGSNTGFIGNLSFGSVEGAPQPGGFNTFDTVGKAIQGGWISNVPPAVGSQNQWYSARSICFNAGNSPSYYNPVTTPKPEMFPSQGGMRLHKSNTIASCSTGNGFYGTSGIYQVIQGLTAGVSYRLEIDIDNPDTSTYGKLKIGSQALNGGLTVGGQTYTNLGGDNSAIYGNTGLAGEWQDPPGTNTGTAFYNCQDSTTQVNTFVSQGGNEVFSMEYSGLSDSFGAGNGVNVDFGLVRIYEIPSAPYNISTIYTVADSKNTPNGLGTYTGEVIVNVVQAELLFDAITISQDSFPISGSTAVGLQPTSTSPIIFSNNPVWNPTHPLTLGVNTASFVTNFSDSVAPFNDEDRFFEITCISEDGGDIIISNADYQYTTYSSSTTTESIDYSKSIVGRLEVSNSEDFPLNISYTVSDGKDLESRFGDFSQTFDLPATAKNNKILNNIWKATVDQSLKKTFGMKDCRILVDGLPFFEGSMQIKKSSQDGSPKSYSCTIYGGNFSWMSLLKDKFMCTVFGDDEEFLYSYQEVEATWTKTHANSDIQYPLISYKDFNQNGIPNYINTFDENLIPDFQPAFYVVNLLKKIFDGIGYTLDSTFFDTDHFKRLINTFPFLSNDAEDDETFYSSNQHRAVNDEQIIADNTDMNNLPSWTTCILPVNDGDQSNSYNNTTGVWTCQKAGEYVVNAQMGYFLWLNSSHPGNCDFDTTPSCPWDWDVALGIIDVWTHRSRVKVSYLTGGNAYVGTTSTGWGPTDFLLLAAVFKPCFDCSVEDQVIPPGSIMLNVGDTIELQGQYIASSQSSGCTPRVRAMFGQNSGLTEPYGSVRCQMSINYSASTPTIGNLVRKNNILSCGLSQIDYIKSISQLFNLYFTTDVQSKTIHVEPFNEFYKDKSEGVDWSMKVDYGQEMEDDYNIGLKKELNIGYKLDSSDVFSRIMNEEQNIQEGDTQLFNYNENLGEDYESGTVNINNKLFASSIQVWDNDTHDSPNNDKAPVLIPVLWDRDCYTGISIGNTQARPTEMITNFVPRIFYYCWENTVSNTSIPGGQLVNPSGTQTYYSRIFSSGSAFQNQTTYPRATFVDWEEYNQAVSMRPSLSFRDESFVAPGQATTNEVPGLYSVYYKNMIEQLKQSPRIRTVYINLKITDILNLDVRKLVYLDDSWWRINKVSEYSPANNQSTAVELIQWLDVGFYPLYSGSTIINYT
tara:strand:+ start:5 stop:4000 length:3996 start_codon:yes stop_codon:yes gene_type:complete